MSMAGFSRLDPGAHIKPRVGYDEYSRYVLRLHLGLETNQDCGLRVANETRSWEEGKTLIFCDAVEHEAWKRGTTTRTVVLLDFKNPRHRFRFFKSELERGVCRLCGEGALARNESPGADALAAVEAYAPRPQTATRRRVGLPFALGPPVG
jgi:beta-hydroxylase